MQAIIEKYPWSYQAWIAHWYASTITPRHHTKVACHDFCICFVYWSIIKYDIVEDIFRILLVCIFALKWVHFLSYHKHFWFNVPWCFPYFQNIDEKQVTKNVFFGKMSIVLGLPVMGKILFMVETLIRSTLRGTHSKIIWGNPIWEISNLKILSFFLGHQL